MAHFPTNVFHEVTGITDALKKNAQDQNEQPIRRCIIFYILDNSNSSILNSDLFNCHTHFDILEIPLI